MKRWRLDMIHDALMLLADRHPYYLHILSQVILKEDNNMPHPIGVGVDNSNIILVVNRHKFSEYTLEEQASLLQHECIHITMNHLSQPGYKEDPIRWNLAMDAAINQFISHLPEGSITLPLLEKMYDLPKLPHLETSEVYYKYLQNVPDEQRIMQLDAHSFEQENSELTKSISKHAVETAVKDCAGNIPHDLKKYIDQTLRSGVDWKAQLRNFVATLAVPKYKATIKRRNRRHSPPVPGRKKLREVKLGVCWDVSGSINDEQVAQFFAETKSLTKIVSKVYLVQADSRVQSATLVTSSTVLPVRNGYGGTAYQPAIDKCLEIGCNGIIYFGDFDCADTPTNPKVPFLWVGISNQKPPVTWGKVIRI